MIIHGQMMKQDSFSYEYKPLYVLRLTTLSALLLYLMYNAITAAPAKLMNIRYRLVGKKMLKYLAPSITESSSFLVNVASSNASYACSAFDRCVK